MSYHKTETIQNYSQKYQRTQINFKKIIELKTYKIQQK